VEEREMSAWFYVEADKVMGPLTAEEADAGVQSGLLGPDTPIWKEGMLTWMPVATTPEFSRYFTQDQITHARLSSLERLPALPKVELPEAPPRPPEPRPAAPAHPSYPLGYQQPQYPAAYGEPRSKLVAGLLGIFLGWLGIHRFYLGYSGIGVVMLLISVLTCGVGTMITSIWGLVEGILCLTGSMTDAYGRPLVD
jgi:TM2 domain-containing membrane protein YozV